MANDNLTKEQTAELERRAKQTPEQAEFEKKRSDNASRFAESMYLDYKDLYGDKAGELDDFTDGIAKDPKTFAKVYNLLKKGGKFSDKWDINKAWTAFAECYNNHIAPHRQTEAQLDTAEKFNKANNALSPQNIEALVKQDKEAKENANKPFYEIGPPKDDAEPLGAPTAKEAKEQEQKEIQDVFENGVVAARGAFKPLTMTPVGPDGSFGVYDAAKLAEKRRSIIDTSLNSQIERTGNNIAELEEKLEKRRIELYKKNHPVVNDEVQGNKADNLLSNLKNMRYGAYDAGLYSSDDWERENDPEYSTILATLEQERKNLNSLNNAKKKKLGIDGNMGQFWRVIGQTVSDPDTWNSLSSVKKTTVDDRINSKLELADRANEIKIKQQNGETLTKEDLDILNRVKNGEATLTDEEKAYQTASYNSGAIREEFKDYFGWGDKYGQQVASSIPFMVDFITTRGFSSATGSIAKMLPRVVSKLGSKAITKAPKLLGWAAKKAPKAVEKFLVKATGKASEFALRGSMIANTVQLPDLYVDTLNDYLGGVTKNPITGRIEYDNTSKDKSLLNSYLFKQVDYMIENGSEMGGGILFRYLGKGLKLAGAPTAKLLAKMPGIRRLAMEMDLGRFDKFINTASRIIRNSNNTLKVAGIHGVVEEVGEEYDAQIERTLLGLKSAKDPMTGKNLFNDRQFHIDTWLGMLLSVGYMHAASLSLSGASSAANYAIYKHNVNKADTRASVIFGRDRWETLRQSIDETDNANLGNFVDNSLNDNGVNKGKFSEEQKQALLDYIGNSMLLRGYNINDYINGKYLAYQKGAFSGQFNKSYLNGMGMTDPKEMTDANNMFEYQLGKFMALSGMSREAAIRFGQTTFNITLRGETPTEEEQVMIDFLNASKVLMGVGQAARNNIDLAITKSDATINNRINKETGKIHSAILKADGRQVYIVKGNPEQVGDNNNKSSFVVIDAVTGKSEMVSGADIQNVAEALDPTQEKDKAAKAIKDNGYKELNDNISGALKFQIGDVYKIASTADKPFELTVVADENGIAVDNNGNVNVNDGEKTFKIHKDILRELVNRYNYEQFVKNFEEQAGVTTQQPQQPTTQQVAKYNKDDELTLTDGQGNEYKAKITAAKDEDGRYEVQTDKPLNGKTVGLYSEEELDKMNLQPKPKGEQPQAGSAQQVTGAEEVETPKVPIDETGKPIYTQAKPEDAWDYILEKLKGNSEKAKRFVANRIAIAEKNLKEAEKAKTPQTEDLDEFDKADSAREAAIAKAQQALEAWKKIANVETQRAFDKQEQERKKLQAEADKKKAEEEKKKKEKEEADRIAREQLNGVPEMQDDTPKDARARGYRRKDDKKYERQKPIKAVKGKDTDVRFTTTLVKKGTITLVSAKDLQPSHIRGQRNPYFFIDEAQPKDRKDAVSIDAAEKIARNVRPEEIASFGGTAYTGAPSVNARGEAIQGNNRIAALREMYENPQYKESARKYKQYLIDHAEELGLNAEDIEKMEDPVAVNMLDVNDDTAIQLGQYTVQNVETGHIVHIDPKTTLQKAGDKFGRFIEKLFNSKDEEATLAALISANGQDALHFLREIGAIDNNEYRSALDTSDPKRLTGDAQNDIRKLLFAYIFKDAPTQLSDMFDTLPAKAQKAILATAYRDIESPKSERIIKEVQDSIRACYYLMQQKEFAEAGSYEMAKAQVEIWKNQYVQDFLTGESVLPAEQFSNFALALAAIYRGQTQSYIKNVFNDIYDLIQGKAESMFDEKGKKMAFEDAIKEVLNIDYNGKIRSIPMDGKPSQGAEGGQGGARGNRSGEQAAQGGEQADNTGGVEGNGGEEVNPEQSKDTAKPQKGSEGEAVPKPQTPDTEGRARMEERKTDQQGNPIDKEGKLITEKVGSIDELTDEDFTNPTRSVELPTLPKNVQEAIGTNGKPVVIKKNVFEKNKGNHSELNAKESKEVLSLALYSPNLYGNNKPISSPDYRVVVHTGEKNSVVVLDVYNGKDNVEIVGWRKVNEKGLEKMKKQAEREGGQLLILSPDSGSAAALSALPSGSLSTDKGTKTSESSKTEGEKVKEAEEQTDTNPTDGQKEAGNYKKGHVQVGKFDISIEQPKGSIRSGVDENGRKWESKMNNTYGYIKGTQGVDGDHIDVFLSDNIDGWDGKSVFVIDQYNPDGSFDEHKVMLGFNSQEEAYNNYLANYEKGWEKGRKIVISSTTIEEFEKWIDSSHRKTKAFAEYKSTEQHQTEIARQNEQSKKNKPNTDKALEEAKRLGVKTEIVMNEDELPQSAKDARLKAKKEGKDLGAWYDLDTKKVYVFAPTCLTPLDALATIWHEGVAHHGLRKLLGDKRYNRVCDAVWKGMNKGLRDKKLEYAFNTMGKFKKIGLIGTEIASKKWGNLTEAEKEIISNNRDFQRFAADEYMADVSESGSFRNLDRTSWQTICDAIKELLAELGIKVTFTDADIEAILSKSERNLVKGVNAEKAAARGNGEIRDRMVYHGSRNEFDKFDHSHMGEGEGAQAYGWGTYITEVNGIAKMYATKAADKNPNRFYIRKINELQNHLSEISTYPKYAYWLDTIIRWSNEDIEREKRLNKADSPYIIKEAEHRIAELKTKYNGSAYNAEVDACKKELNETEEEYRQEREKKLKGKRHLYTVEIPDDNGNNYLRWEKEVSKELWNERIKPQLLKAIPQSSIKDIEENTGRPFSEIIKDFDDMMGRGECTVENMYSGISTLLGTYGNNNPEAASKFLSSCGFTGIKYPAEYRSGGRGDNAMNYVIFKESDAQITDHLRFKIKTNETDKEIIKRAEDIKALKPIKVEAHNMSKDELQDIFTSFKPVIKKGKQVSFFNSTFKKIYKDGGLFAKAVPKLREAFDTSIFAYGEEDNRGGTIRPDGTRHKTHPNVVFFDNYVNKLSIDEKEYYVRFTVQNQNDDAGVHSTFVSNVELYNNPAKSLSLPAPTRTRGTFDWIIDTKLQEFFDYANSLKEKDVAKDSQTPDTEGEKDLRFSIKKETEDIISKAKKDGTYMKAPNGKPSNLPEKMWVHARTKSFKEWFGDWENDPEHASKVVDENGEPLVVYRGMVIHEGEDIKYTLLPTHRKDMTQGSGIYLTRSREVAERYAQKAAYDYQVKNGIYGQYGKWKPVVLECFVNARNPLGNFNEAVDKDGKYKGISGRIKGGYDAEFSPYDESIVVNSPNQIKSATDNNGEFSKTNDDILHSDTYEQGEEQTQTSEKPNLQQVVDKVNEVIKLLNLKNVEIITDDSQLEKGEQVPFSTKGGYRRSEGRIRIYAHHIESLAQAEQAVLHEAVGHYGLRVLLGKHFDEFIKKVYDNADAKARRGIAELAANNKWDIYKATEEYLSELAQKTDFEKINPTFWEKVKMWFKDMLRKVGFKNIEMSENEMRYELWRSYQNLKGNKYSNIFSIAEDIAMQNALKVGKFEDEKRGREDIDEMSDERKGQIGNKLRFAKAIGAAVGVIKANNELSARKAAEKWWKENIGEPLFYPTQVGTVEINDKSIEDSLAHRYSQAKLDAIATLKEGFKNAVYLGSAKDTTRKRAYNHYFAYPINYNSERCYVFCRALNDLNTNRLYVHEVFIADKITKSDTLQTAARWLHGGIALYKSILADVLTANVIQNFENPTLPEENSNASDDWLNMDTSEQGTDTPKNYFKVQARDTYERRVKTGMYQSLEALQDSMLGLKELMLAVMKASGDKRYIEEMEGYMNPYTSENALSSVNNAEAEAMDMLIFKPLVKEIALLAKNDDERGELYDYMMAKHGLERNRVMAERDAKVAAVKDASKSYDEWLDYYRHKDYAGLTALTKKDKVKEAEAEAAQMVKDYEKAYDTKPLWDRVKAATSAVLSKQYESSLMSKERYDKIKDMYEYYIPLRGFDEKTGEEVYAYLNSKDSAFTAPIRAARGRKSKADDPMATLRSMAESTIAQGNRNKLVKQRFLNFVLNHPSDLVSVSDLWIEYDEKGDVWKPALPEGINATDTPEKVEDKMKAFDEKMQKLAEQHPDRYKRVTEETDVPYRVVQKSDLQQHQVIVKRGGKEYVLTINGNPRAAQAINGLTNPDTDLKGIFKRLESLQKFNRTISSFYTTRNPDFIVSNFFRDMLYSNTMAWVKESPKYALRYHKNYTTVANPANMKILFAKYRKGTLDMNKKTERLFSQFIKNGGETGYTNIKDIEQHKKEIAREIKKMQGKMPIGASIEYLAERLDEYNRAIENCARFAAFVTSREFGRDMVRSIYDAKEISVNFNKKGSGARFLGEDGQTWLGNRAAEIAGFGKMFYIFWNAAMQGSANAAKATKRHPIKALTAMATMYLLGGLIASLGSGDGDDDDKGGSYFDLPEYVRRSNIVFKAGDSWISIPLPVEFRAIYGLGELSGSMLSGKETKTGWSLAGEAASQISQIMPIDMLEGGGGLKNLIPSAGKPLAEALVLNKSWSGLPLQKENDFNKNMPAWTKAYKSADKHLVNLSAAVNDWFGGDKYTQSWADFSPAKLEYLLNGYFGGISNTINKMVKMVETATGSREYDPQNFLFVNRLVKKGDERTENRHVNEEYFRLKEEHDKVQQRVRGYDKEMGRGVFEYAERINFLNNSPEYQRYLIYEDHKDKINELSKDLKEVTDDKIRKTIEQLLLNEKKMLVNEVADLKQKKHKDDENE